MLKPWILDVTPLNVIPEILLDIIRATTSKNEKNFYT